MRLPRSSGVLLHITSLPSRFGIGGLGAEAYAFVDFLEAAGQRIWQVLPLGPPAAGNSPYSCYSAFAGNPLLICPEQLVRSGWLAEEALYELPGNTGTVDFGAVWDKKLPLLTTAARHFWEHGSAQDQQAFAQFEQEQAYWLADFALFSALRNHLPTCVWTTWDRDLATRDPATLDAWRARLGTEIREAATIQFFFWVQWQAVKRYANAQGIRIFGDMPLFVAHDSADVWVHQELFSLDELGHAEVVAGVPPDAFSETGQVWNNPLFRWDAVAASGYTWWKDRIRCAFESFDMLRIDHFRGLEAYWEIPAGDETAVNGRWVEGPGDGPIAAAKGQLGEICLVAEDLGLITDEVHALREGLDVPGMRVLQFGFGAPDDTYHRPESYPSHSVAYTGTHDNETTVGWLENLAAPSRELVAPLLTGERPAHWELIAHVMGSAADTTIFPMQDLLGLDNEARMNTPGRAEDNWLWQLKQGQASRELASELARLAQQHDRCAPLACNTPEAALS